MAGGILGGVSLEANINQAIYACDKTIATVAAVNLCNRNATSVTVRVAISTSQSAPTAAEWIAYDVTLAPHEVLERKTMVSPGQYIVVRSSHSDVTAMAWGTIHGNTYSVAPIVTQTGTAPVWLTDADLATIYAGETIVPVQLEAQDPEAEALTYSLTSGSLPTGLTLSSTGLISGTTSTTGYTLGIPDEETSITVTATDTRSHTTPKTFNIVRRWMDGSSQNLAAQSAQFIYNLSTSYQGTGASNWFWIRGSGPTSEARKMYCNMTDGGYMLWYHYRDPMSGTLTINDPANSGTMYNLTDTINMFMYGVPEAIANQASYLYLNSSNDTNYLTPTFSQYKYAIALDPTLRAWVQAPKGAATNWGIDSVTVNTIYLSTPVDLPNYRYGSSIGEMQYGHNKGGADEVDGLAFRNSYGTGGYKWTTSTHIWDYAGWGAIDASSPTNVNTGWGSTGRDEGTWSGTNRQDHIYAWIK